jgi:hypothetical protein
VERRALWGIELFLKQTRMIREFDMARLKKMCGNRLPDDPGDQNQLWCRFHKSVEKRPALEHVQRDFLLMRHYGAFAALAIFAIGAPHL